MEIYLDELRGAIKKNSAKDTGYMGRNFGPRLTDNTTPVLTNLAAAFGLRITDFDRFMKTYDSFLASFQTLQFAEYSEHNVTTDCRRLLPVAIRPFQFGIGFPYN